MLGLTRASRVVDLAAGTGKLSRALAPLVGEVVAVEPSASMRRVLRATTPGVTALDGEAEAIPAADSSADGVFAGEARRRAVRNIGITAGRPFTDPPATAEYALRSGAGQMAQVAQVKWHSSTDRGVP